MKPSCCTDNVGSSRIAGRRAGSKMARWPGLVFHGFLWLEFLLPMTTDNASKSLLSPSLLSPRNGALGSLPPPGLEFSGHLHRKLKSPHTNAEPALTLVLVCVILFALGPAEPLQNHGLQHWCIHLSHWPAATQHLPSHLPAQEAWKLVYTVQVQGLCM